jgi:hypothetical protein
MPKQSIRLLETKGDLKEPFRAYLTGRVRVAAQMTGQLRHIKLKWIIKPRGTADEAEFSWNI